jgi:hypothetical protein
VKFFFVQCIEPQHFGDFAVEGTLEEELEPREVGSAALVRVEVLLQKSQLLLELLKVDILQDNRPNGLRMRATARKLRPVACTSYRMASPPNRQAISLV